MNNKAIGADMMRMGERSNTLAADNYGGRKWFRTVEVALNYVLTCNSIWGRQGRAVIMSNDAKGCYDRIAHVVVELALQRYSIPKPAIESIITTIQEMEHFVRTAFGDSSQGYHSKNAASPLQGILQGNGAGPAGWFGISTVLINLMRQNGFGYKEWTLIKKRAICWRTQIYYWKKCPDPRCDVREYQGGMQPRAHSVLITPNTGCGRRLIRDKILE